MKNFLRCLCSLLLGTIILFSCGKERFAECTESDCLIFEGKVVEMDNEALENADITLVHTEPFLEDREVIVRTRTDGSGHFRISLDGDPYQNGEDYFDLKAAKSGYIEKSITIQDVDTMRLDIPVSVNIDLAPEGFVELEFERGTDIRDLEYNLEVEYINTFFTLNESASPDTLYTYRVQADRFVKVYYTYKKDAQTINKSDSVFVDRGLTQRLKIEID